MRFAAGAILPLSGPFPFKGEEGASDAGFAGANFSDILIPFTNSGRIDSYGSSDSKFSVSVKLGLPLIIPNQSRLWTNKSGLPVLRRNGLNVLPWKLHGSKRSTEPRFHSPTQSPMKSAVSEFPLETILAQVFRRPVLEIPGEQVRSAVSIDVRWEELVVAGHATPSRNVAIIAMCHLQSRSGRSKHPQVRHAPIVSVENVEIRLPISVEISDIKLIVAREPTPAGNITVVACRHLQAASRGRKHSYICHAPIVAVEDEEISLPTAAIIADEKFVILCQPAPARNISIETLDERKARIHLSAAFRRKASTSRLH